MIYVAQFCLADDVEAERDDPSFDAESMSSPQFSRLSTRMSADWVQKCKDDVEEAYTEMVSDPSCELAYRWETTGWNEVSPVNGRRSNQTFTLYEDALAGDEPVAWLVIQRAPADE